jgi:hypothetical protein
LGIRLSNPAPKAAAFCSVNSHRARRSPSIFDVPSERFGNDSINLDDVDRFLRVGDQCAR